MFNMLKLVLNNELILIRIQLYEFHKNPVPEQDADKKRFAAKLMEFGVSLKQYREALSMREITL